MAFRSCGSLRYLTLGYPVGRRYALSAHHRVLWNRFQSLPADAINEVAAVRAFTALPEVPYYRNAMSLARTLNLRITDGVKRFGRAWRISVLFAAKYFLN